MISINQIVKKIIEHQKLLVFLNVGNLTYYICFFKENKKNN
jgi:hypothetical protein